MREAILFCALFASILVDGSNANAVIRRDDGQHDVEESNNDSVEFAQHEVEREEKARQVDGAEPVTGAVVTASRHLLDQLEELSRLQPRLSAAATDNAASNARLMSSFDYLARSLLSRKAFQIECCRGGVPQITQPDLVRNFTYNAGEYLTDETETGGADGEESPEAGDSAGVALNCRMYYGMYYTPPTALLNFELSYAIQVVCKCPDIGPNHQLDKNCRRLPTCKNNGRRSNIDPRTCFCQQPFFGDKCEKFCDRGQRLTGLNGRDYCSCSPFYVGEECRDVVCMNGGREENGRCICAPQFLGYHCEIDTNRTKAIGGANHFHTPIDLGARAGGGIGAGSDATRYQRFGDHVSNEMFTRDISGTIFSLIMIIVLIVSMYLLMKHRMTTRYLSRRPDLLNACNFPIGNATTTSGAPSTARRVELMPTFDEAAPGGPTSARTFPFRNFVGNLANSFIPGDGGPPPYIAPGQRGRRSRNEVLPPLPSYEDATKLPPLRQNIGIEQVDRDAPVSNDRSIEMVPRTATAVSGGATVRSSSDDQNVADAPGSRRQRPSRYITHYENGDANVLSNTEAQEEAVSLRSADDGNDKSPTTNAMTFSSTGSNNSSQNSLPSNNRTHSTENNETQQPSIEPTTNNERHENNNTRADGNCKSNRRSSESSIAHKQQQQRRRQQRERSLDVENATQTTTVDSRHTAV